MSDAIVLTKRKPNRRPRLAVTEDSIQERIVRFLRLVLCPRRYRVAAVPNGGFRNPAEAAKLKRTGTLAGVFDLLIFGDCGRCWFIECKTAAGELSIAQKEMREWMSLIGVPYWIARSTEDAQAAIEHWSLETRGKLQ